MKIYKMDDTEMRDFPDDVDFCQAPEHYWSEPAFEHPVLYPGGGKPNLLTFPLMEPF